MEVPVTLDKRKRYYTNEMCQKCGVNLRKFPSASTKKINTADEVATVFDQFSFTIQIGQKLCPKCRRKIVFNPRKKQKIGTEVMNETATLNHPSLSDIPSEISAQPSTSNHEILASQILSFSQRTDSEESSQSSTLDDPSFRPKSEYSSDVNYILLPILRCSSSEKYCCICGDISKRSRVPFEARLHCYQRMKIFIPSGARACPEHILNNRFYQDDLNKIKICSKSSQVPVSEVSKLIEGLTVESNKSLLNEAGAFRLSEDRLKALTGFTSDNLKKLTSWMKSSRDSHNRTVVEGLITFLFKLRTGASNSNIATIFKFDRDQIVSDISSTIIGSFEENILPTRFGVKKDITDSEVKEAMQNLIKNHTSLDARKLLKLRDDQLCLIFDGTYIKHQKSSNNEYQRHSYSGQKKAPLIKPFTVSTTDGYVVDICGPYEGIKNDAEITKTLLKDFNGIFRLMKKDDIIIVDRGFRDVVKLLREKLFIVKMPALKYRRKQLTTAEANESRLVTKIRWVIEAVHGQVKQKFKLLHHQMDNKLLSKAKTLCRIAFFLNNEFGKRFKTDESISDEIISRMLKPTYKENTLAQEVEKENWSRKIKPFQKLNSTDLEDFPEITERDLKILFSGTYQLAMAISYLAEILNENNALPLKYLKAQRNIIAISVRSRHISSKTYKCYIDYRPYANGISGIQRYTCDCPNDLRTIGCCCHVAAVIYYLGNARYQSKIFKPAEKLTTLFREEAVDLGRMEGSEPEIGNETQLVADDFSQGEPEESRGSSDEDYDSD